MIRDCPQFTATEIGVGGENQDVWQEEFGKKWPHSGQSVFGLPGIPFCWVSKSLSYTTSHSDVLSTTVYSNSFSTRGEFALQEAAGNIWRYLRCHNWEGQGYWQQVGCCWTYKNVQNSPSQLRNIQPKRLKVLTLRNPGLQRLFQWALYISREYIGIFPRERGGCREEGYFLLTLGLWAMIFYNNFMLRTAKNQKWWKQRHGELSNSEI